MTNTPTETTTENQTANDSIFQFPKANFNDIDSKLPVIWVLNEDALYDLIDEIDSVDTVFLDTEFIKRSTYYPVLALVQVNTGKAIYLVDAPKLDLTEFWQALAEVPTMVWYACGEDLGIFYLLAKCPPLTNVFDVQIGVAYLTGKLQAGFAQAVSEVLGIALDKGESQSNWLARPLTTKQEVYAVNDVRYLSALYTAVRDELSARGVLEHMLEDTQHYVNELHTAQNTEDDALYLDLIAPIYSRRQLGVLQQLTAWRESLARATNEPKSFIIGKQALREIVIDMPDSIKALARTSLNRGVLRRYGEEIVKIIKQVLSADETDLPQMPPPNYHSKEKPFKNDLNAVVDAYSLKHQIPANLLLKNRWMNDLLLITAYGGEINDLPAELLGYRRSLVTDGILPALAQHQAQILSVFEEPIPTTLE